MNSFDMWNDKIVFVKGWYLYIGSKGNNSVLTRACAKNIEEEYYRYQADMDVMRRGIKPEAAYPSRGFKKIGNDYVYNRAYKVDALSGGKTEIHFGKKLMIPSEVEGIPITCIYKNAFSNRKSLEEVTIPDSIEAIGNKAFSHCVNLHKINLPQKQMRIAEDAFEDTAIGKTGDRKMQYLGRHLCKADKGFCGICEIEEGTLSVADGAFRDCEKLEKILIPDSVQSIGRNAFAGCVALKEIVMPRKLYELGERAFLGCAMLNKVTVPQGISCLQRAVFKDCVSLQEIALPDTLEKITFDCFENTKVMNDFKKSKEETLYIGKWLICYRAELEGRLEIRNGTEGIADCLCMYHNMDKRTLSAVSIPESMKYIGMEAFACCAGLDAVHLPEGIISVGQNAFSDCRNLKSIVIPKSVQNIEQWAFTGCESMESITFLNPKTKIIWPAITDRRDGKQRHIIADPDSEAEKYCVKYGKKYHLQFEKRKQNET